MVVVSGREPIPLRPPEHQNTRTAAHEELEPVSVLLVIEFTYVPVRARTVLVRARDALLRHSHTSVGPLVRGVGWTT